MSNVLSPEEIKQLRDKALLLGDPNKPDSTMVPTSRVSLEQAKILRNYITESTPAVTHVGDILEQEGRSKFDQGMPAYVFDTPDGIQNYRGDTQSKWDKIANGLLVRFPATTATKLLEGAGYVGGAIGWAATGDINAMTENPFSKMFAEAEEEIKKIAPIYLPEHVRNADDLLDKIFSLSFWMDEAVDAAAFFAGFALIGGGIGKAGKAFNAIAKAFKGTEAVAKGLQLGTATLIQTISEAGFEAAHFGKEFEHDIKEKLDSLRNELYSQGASNQYIEEVLATEKNRLNEEKAKAQVDIFNTNVGILLGPNIIMNKMLFGKAFGGKSNVLRRLFNEAGDDVAAIPSLLTKKEIAGRVAKSVGLGVFSEGFFEEGLQETASKYMGKRALGETDSPFLKGMIDTYVENLSDVNFQSAIFLGGLLGALGGGKSAYSSSKADNRMLSELHSTIQRNPNSAISRLFTSAEGLNKLSTQERALEMFEASYKLQKLSKVIERDVWGDVLSLTNHAETLGGYVEANNLLDWSFTLLQQEGGLEILKKQINSISKQAYEEYAKSSEATLSESEFNQHKVDLISQLSEFKKIVDRVNNRYGAFAAELTNTRDLPRKNFNELKSRLISELAFSQVNTLVGIEYFSKVLNKNTSEIIKLSSEVQTQDKIDTIEVLQEENREINNILDGLHKDFKVLTDNKRFQAYFEAREDKRVKNKKVVEKALETGSLEEVKQLRTFEDTNNELDKEQTSLDEAKEKALKEKDIEDVEDSDGWVEVKDAEGKTIEFKGKFLGQEYTAKTKKALFAQINKEHKRLSKDIDSRRAEKPDVPPVTEQIKNPIETDERQLDSSGEIVAPMKPFNGTVDAFFHTTAREVHEKDFVESLVNSLNDKNNTKSHNAESQLAFQRLIDDLADGTETRQVKFKLLNKASLLSEYGEFLSEEQKAWFQESGVFVVPIVGGKPILATSVLREGQTLLYSTLRDVAGISVTQNGTEVLSQYGTAFIDARKRIDELEDSGISRSEAVTKVTEELTKAISEYTAFRDTIVKEGQTPIYGYQSISAGHLNLTDSTITFQEATGIAPEKTKIVVAKGTSTVIGETTISSKPGMVYINYGGRAIPTVREKLKSEDINRIVDIIQYMFTLNSKQKDASNEAKQAIKDLTYFIYPSKGATLIKDNQLNAFTFFIQEKDDKAVNLHIGNTVIPASEIAGRLDEIKAFLATKYYQVDDAKLNSEHKIDLKKVEKGKLVADKSVNYNTWLLDGKILVKLTRKEKTTTSHLLNNAVHNRSIKLNIPVKPATRYTPKKTTTATKPPVGPVRVEPVESTYEPSESMWAEFNKAKNEDTSGIIEVSQPSVKAPTKSIEITHPTNKVVYEVSIVDGQGVVTNKKSGITIIPTSPVAKKVLGQLTEEMWNELGEAKVEEKVESEVKPLPKKEEVGTSEEVSSTIQQLLKGQDKLKFEKKESSGKITIKRDTKSDEAHLTTPAVHGRAELMDFEAERQAALARFPDADIQQTGRPLTRRDGRRVLARIIFNPTGRTRVEVGENVPIGTLWHEMGHEWIRRHITPTQRLKLLDEAVRAAGDNVYIIDGVETTLRELGTKLSSKEFYDVIEEFLMEEFRDYVNSGGAYTFGKAQKAKEGIFKRMWNWILDLVTKITGKTFNTSNPSEIVKAFETIMNNVWTEGTVVNRPQEVLFKVGELNSHVSNVLVKHFNSMFFDKIFNRDVFNQIDFSKLSEYLPDAYNIVYNDLVDKYEETEDVVTGALLVNWNDLVKEHSKFLRQYRIDIRLPEDIIEDNKLTKDNTQYIQSNLINVKDTMPSEVKLLIAGLTGGGYTLGGTDIVLPVTVDFGKTTALLLNRLAGISSEVSMGKRLADLAVKHDYVKVFMDRVGLTTEGDIKPDLTQREVYLLSKTFNFFHKYNSDMYTTLLTDEGEIYTVSLDEGTRKNHLLDEWKSNIKNDLINKPFRLEGGRYVMDFSKELTINDRTISAAKLFNIDKTGKDILLLNKDFNMSLDDFLSAVTSMFGINVSAVQGFLDGEGSTKRRKLLKEFVGFLQDEIKRNYAAKVPLYADSIFDKNTIKVNKELNSLAAELTKFDENIKDNQILTDKGTEYSIQEKTGLHRIFDFLSNNEIPESLKPFRAIKDSEGNTIDYEGNIETLESVWYDKAEKGEVPRVVILRNMGKEIGDKTDIADLKPGDLYVFEINNILTGTIAFPRSETRGIEYAVDFGKSYVNKNLSVEDMVEQYKKYLKSEIVTALAYINDPLSRKLATENEGKAHKLSFFRNIVPGISEMLEEAWENSNTESVTNELANLNSTQWLEIAESIVADNADYVTESLTKFIGDSADKIVKNLTKLKLVVPVTETNGTLVYKTIGISNVALNNSLRGELSKYKFQKNKSTPITEEVAITEDQLLRLATLAAYYYSTSGIEFTKLITGNLSTYLKGDISAYHKRTTTFTSTVSGSANSVQFINLLNKHFKRLDGTQHGENRRTWVLSDVKTQSELYDILSQKLSPEDLKGYSKDGMNEADGQSWMTLDGYRSIGIRASIWNDAYERTWQHEAQTGFKMLSAEEIRRNIPLEQRKYTPLFFEKLFKQHMPEGMSLAAAYSTDVTFFNGEVITIQEIAANPLPILKLQGTGQIVTQGFEKFNKRSITKTSVAPLLPSVVKDTSTLYELFAQTAANGIDMVSFESAEKGERLIGSNNKSIPLYVEKENNWIIQNLSGLSRTGELLTTEVSWSNIGNQLNIDPSGKTKVTASSQKRALTFVDIFNLGEITPEFEHLSGLFQEYNYLQNTIVGKARQAFLKRLGAKSVDGELTVTQFNKLRELIADELSSRLVADNLFEGVNLVLDASHKLFDTLPNKRQLINLIQGLFRSNAINIKTRGDMLTQLSVTGFETTPRGARVGNSSVLKSYTPLDANGDPATDWADVVSITPSEAIITLPKSLIPYIEKKFDGATFADKLQRFNEQYEAGTLSNQEELNKIFTFTANRIPGQSINSIEVLKIKRFLSPSAGSLVILPSEIVTKAGSDFDIDKLTSYFNNIVIDKHTGEPSYVEFIEDKNVLWANYKESIKRNKGLLDILAKEGISFEELTSHEEFKDKLSERGHASFLVPDSYNRGIIDLFEGDNFEDVFKELKSQEDVLTKEEFFAKSIGELNSKEAIENRLNEVTSQVVLDKNNYYSLMKPNGAGVFAEQAKALINKKENLSNVADLLDFTYNMTMAENQWSAVAMVGILAVNTTSHSKTQGFPIRFAEGIFANLFALHGKEGANALGYKKDLDKLLISETNASGISAAVDAGKESFPSIFQIHYTSATAAAYQLLNRVGRGSTDPLGFKFLTKFFTSPVIMEYEAQRKIMESAFLENSAAKEAKRDTVNRVLGIVEKDSKSKHKFLYEYLEQLKTQKTPANIQKAKELLGEAVDKFTRDNGFLTDADFTSNNKKVLEVYLYYLELSKYLNTLQEIIRPDAGLPKDAITLRLRKLKKQRLLELGIFNEEDINKIVSESFIREFQETHNNTFDVLKQFDLSRVSPSLDAILWNSPDAVMKIFTDPSLNIPEYKLADIAQRIQNAFVTSVIHLTPVRGEALSSHYARLFQGTKDQKSFAKRLLDIKKNFPDNKFLNDLIPVINEFVPKSQRVLEIDYVKTFGGRMVVEDSNSTTESIRELYDSNDPVVQEFLEDLMTISLLESGVQISPFSFFEVLPAERYQPIVQRVFDEFLHTEKLNKAGAIVNQSLKDKVMANLINNTRIVPRAVIKGRNYFAAIRDLKKDSSGRLSEGVLRVPAFYNFSNYSYISFDHTSLTKAEQTKLKDQGIRVPRETYLFKEILDPNGEPQIDANGFKLYQLIPRFGEPNKMFEVSEQSIIERNNHGESFENVVDSQAIEVTDEYTQPTTTATVQPTIKDNRVNIYAGTGENAHLSNFAIRPFKIDLAESFGGGQVVSFKSVEQAYQYSKVSYMNVFGKDSTDLQEEILNTTDGAKLRQLGKKYPLRDTKLWDSHSSTIMKNFIKSSFEQNSEALANLLATGNKKFTHQYKGVEQDKGRFSKLLMEVRDELRDTQPTTETPIERETRTGEIKLTPHQTAALHKMRAFLDNSSKKMGTLKGNAGTGKTTIIKEIVKDLPQDQILYVAPTHKAKLVLSRAAGSEAMTLEAALFIDLDESTGKFRPNEYKRKKYPMPVQRKKYIIVDESSMLSDNMLKELDQFTNSGQKIIFMGDNAQLPPVGQESDSKVFSYIEAELTEIIRQKSDSPILRNATTLVKNIESTSKKLDVLEGGSTEFNAKENTGIIFEKEISDVLKMWERDFRANPENTRIVTFNNQLHSNRYSVNNLNKVAREMLYGSNPEWMYVGEQLMAYDSLSNGYVDIINNALDYTVVRMDKVTNHSQTIEASSMAKGVRTVTLTELSGVYADLKNNITGDVVKEVFIPDPDAVTKINKAKERAFKEEDKQMGFKIGKAFANLYYGYAITSHKSQGSTYRNVYVMKDNILHSDSMRSIKSKNQSLYVGISRASDKAVVHTVKAKAHGDTYFTENPTQSTHLSAPVIDNNTTFQESAGTSEITNKVDLAEVKPSSQFNMTFNDLVKLLGLNLDSKSKITFEGKTLNTYEMFDFIRSLKGYLDGKTDKTSLPKGVGTFIMSILPDTSVIKRALYKEIENTELYQDYLSQQGDTLTVPEIKDQAIGDVIEMYLLDIPVNMDIKSKWRVLSRDLRSILKIEGTLTEALFNKANTELNEILYNKHKESQQYLKDNYFPESESENLSVLLDKIANSNHTLNELAGLLRSMLVQDIRVSLIDVIKDPETGKEYAGQYRSDLDSIQLSKSARHRKGAEVTILHEALHAASYRVLEGNNQEAKDFNKLYEAAKAHFGNVEYEGVFYPLKTKHEFLVGLFENGAFIQKLMQVPPVEGMKEYKNLFTQIWDTILRSLGITKEVDFSMYNQAFALATHIVTQNVNLRREAQTTEQQRYSELVESLDYLAMSSEEVAASNRKEVNKTKIDLVQEFNELDGKLLNPVTKVVNRNHQNDLLYLARRFNLPESDVRSRQDSKGLTYYSLIVRKPSQVDLSFAEALRQNVPMFEFSTQAEMEGIIQLIEEGKIEIVC
jgi:predicted NAD-dependent protein-ADP-ribosyltransferase YbiA (DUF1768 family)